MGLQTLVHSPRLEKGRKRLGWGGKRPDCHLWSCHPLQAEDFHLPSPAQHTEHSKSLPSGPKAAQDLSGTTLTAILSILHSFPHFSFPAVNQTHRLVPPQGLSCLLRLDSIPPDHHMLRHLLCSCITQSSPPVSGISSPVCLALSIQETSQSRDVQSGNPHPFPRSDSLSVFCSEEKSTLFHF